MAQKSAPGTLQVPLSNYDFSHLLFIDKFVDFLMDLTRAQDSTLLISKFRNDFLSVRNFLKLDKSAPGTLQVPLSNYDFSHLLFIDKFADFFMD